ncbi:MAG: hypothetical protein CTY15_03360 [Methylocystis sp.]|nr:MAG: hypothetical protein CTY15_03360 [Methylocystis sp.]
MSGGQDEKQKVDIPTIPMLFDPMEQMRELLFGATKRETDGQLNAVDAKVDEMRKEFLARFEALESRLVEVALESQKSQAASLEAIGDAIGELGAAIKKIGAKRDV